MSTLEALGRAIRRRRRALGIQQHELAESIGLTRASISNIEAGRQDTTVSNLQGIADILHITLGELFGEQPTVQTPEVLILPGYQIRCERCGPLGFAADHGRARATRTVHIKRDHLEV